MKFISATIFSLLFAGSCAHKTDPKTGVKCLTDKAVWWKQNRYEMIFKDEHDSGFADPKGWILLKDDCWKRKYRHGRVEFIIYRDHVTEKIYGIYSNDGFEVSPKQCLTKAVAEIKSLKLPLFDRILAKAQQTYGTRWNDKDVGAASFIKCNHQSKKDYIYYGSLGTFLHELTHIVGNKCRYNPWQNDVDCDLNDDMSHFFVDSIQSRKKWGKFKRSVVEDLIGIQENYLSTAHAERSGEAFLDEMTAYTIGLKLETEFIKRRGEKVFLQSGYRKLKTPFLAMYDLLSRYKKIAASKNSGYKQSKEGLLVLEAFNKADKTFQEWMLALKKYDNKKHPLLKLEKELWEMLKK